jgi:hypothetical protein
LPIEAETYWGTVGLTPTKGHLKLDRAANAELAHAGLESGALDVEEDGGAFGAGDAPLGLLERAENVLAFGFFEGGDWGG